MSRSLNKSPIWRCQKPPNHTAFVKTHLIDVSLIIVPNNPRTMGSYFSSLTNTAVAGGESAVIDIHTKLEFDSHFDAHTASNKLMVIDFSAEWCGPCRLMEPVFESYSVKYPDVDFVNIDVDELSEVSRKWKVQAMPTFVLVKRGKEITRVVGAKKEELERKIVQFKAR